MQIFLIILLAIMISACSPFTLVNGIAPDHGFDVKNSMSYGSHNRQKLDVYYPEVDRLEAPVVVFFYGGSWRRGDRDKYRFIGQSLSSRGYLTIIPDYRVYPDVKFPAFVEDGAASISWIVENISQSENGIILIGHSAGAHLAALLALDQKYLRERDVKPDTVIGMVGLAGPYAFEPENYRRFKPIFENAIDSDESKPITYARGDSPKMLLIHGTDDRVVLPIHSRLLEEKMVAENGRVKLVELQGVGHIGIVLGFSDPFNHLAPELMGNVEDFIESLI